MSLKTDNLRYIGYSETPSLWHHANCFELEQFLLEPNNLELKNVFSGKLRLGKLVEQFVFSDLRQSVDIEILVENEQIMHGKQTIGELDCIIIKNNVPIHLEIVYKFYLYDPNVSENKVSCWIGPNRRDSLIQKITKLKDKQFTLLFRPETKPLLNQLKIDITEIKQQVVFKAQLFIPYNSTLNFENLNEDCRSGFYIHHTQLHHFYDCKFYIPTKLDWLIKPHNEVDWLPYKNFKTQLLIFMKEKSAPLCWVKYPDEQIKKMFVVWWNY